MLKQIKSFLSGKLFLKDSFKAFVIQASSACLIFGSSIILARLLGPEGYGVYVTVYSWYDLLALVALFGFHKTVVRFGPGYLKNSLSKFRGILLYINSHILVVSFVLCSIVLGILYFFDWNIRGNTFTGFLIGLPLIPLLGLGQFYKGVLRTFKQFVKADVPYLVIRYTVIIAGVLFSYYLLGGVTSNFAILYAVLGAFSSLIISFYWVSKNFNIRSIFNSKKKYKVKSWLDVGFSIFVIMGAQFLLKKSDILMVSALSGTKSAGLYQVASQLTLVIVMVLNAVNMIIAPYLSEYYGQNKLQKLKDIVSKSTFLIFIFSILASLILWVKGSFFLVLFGDEYIESLFALRVLILGRIVNALVGSTGLILMMTNQHRLASILTAIALFFNLLLNGILIPIWGIEGAAFSTAVSGAFLNLVMSYFIYKKLDINSTFFSKNMYKLLKRYV